MRKMHFFPFQLQWGKWMKIPSLFCKTRGYEDNIWVIKLRFSNLSSLLKFNWKSEKWRMPLITKAKQVKSTHINDMKGHLLLSWKLHGIFHPHNLTKPVWGEKFRWFLECLSKSQGLCVYLSVAGVCQAPLEELHALAPMSSCGSHLFHGFHVPKPWLVVENGAHL